MNKWLRWSVLGTTLIMIGINIAANVLPLNGQTTGEISEMFDVLFMPAGYVFSIWGLIYLALLVYSGYQFLRVARGVELFDQVAPWVIVANVLNSAWLFFWHWNYIVSSVFVIIALLVSLIVIYEKVRRAKTEFIGQHQREYFWAVRSPFSIYLGWISVATMTNVTVALFVADWSGWGLSDVTWAVILTCIAAVLAVVMIALREDFLFAAVVIWALVGIGMNASAADTVVVGQSQYALFAHGASIVVFLAMLLRGTLPRVTAKQ